MNWFFTGMVIFVVVASFLPLTRHPHWIVRSFEFPRLQLATITAALTMAVFICSLSPGYLTLLLPCLLWQISWILPYTPCWSKEVKEASPRAQRLRIITANVLQNNRQYQPLLSLVREYNPDILVTLESDQHWQAQLDSLTDILPYRVVCPQSNLYGMHVYSRFKLQHTAIEYIIEENIPSIHSQISLPSGVAIDFHFLHPAPPSPTENESAEPRDAELVVVAKRVAKHQRPTIITGDLNDVAWSPTTRLFRKISGLLDPRVGRGMFNTFHTRFAFARWPLDHLFCSHHFRVSALKRLPKFGSDHFALYAELAYEPEIEQRHNGLQPDEADKKRGEEIIEKVETTP
ncbi:MULTISPECIES: endonuclease/exonuclease/phosphatase family protein [unclassified Pseudoalteromonas]|uniref:endonuclease/exonuclease/phosphatase family protein n=1 Tax=unclassified Pseudoalteromonas TaxID=194690 RepID=UPI0030151237